MTKQAPLFSLRDAKKTFGTTQVLKGVTLEVNKGDVVGIIGPSGGGKSTILRACTLLETIDSGSICYKDISVARDVEGKSVYGSKSELNSARELFGLVFQNFNLFPHFTVLKNLTNPACAVKKMNKQDAKEKALALLDKMGLTDKADNVPCDLSGGQQQRVAIARALMLDPEMLFFDEPTSALDPELTKEVLKVIRTLADEDMTMVIVTHEMRFARDVASKICFVNDGIILEEGTPEQIFKNPAHERTRRFLHDED